MNSLKKGLFFLIAFIIFSVPVALNIFSGLDQNITLTLQSWLTTTLDLPLSLFSLLGSFEITSLILLVALMKLGLKKGLVILTIFSLGIGIELLGKIFLFHPGPPPAFFRYSLDILFPSAYVQTGHSFPSGHSYRTAFLTLLLSYLISQSKKLSPIIKKRLTLFLYFILFTMLISRVSLGEHWTTDVIGGVLLGLSFAYFSIYLLSSGFSRLNLLK